jgi:hypothetical protein
MKEIATTEYEYNEFGDIIIIRYWYLDGTYTEKKVFIPPKKDKN